MARKKSLVVRFGGLPAGMPVDDAKAVLQFLYGAFDKQSARQTKMVHPYWAEGSGLDGPPEMSVAEMARWLEAVIA